MSEFSQHLIRFLEQLDQRLSSKKKFLLYLIGGAALSLAYDSENRTADLDLIDPPPMLVKKGGVHSPLAREFRLYISELTEINFSAPPNWRKHCQPFPIAFHHFEIWIPCLEDIILGKLARLAPKDFEDIFSLKEKGLLKAKTMLSRLQLNIKELKDARYRHNSKLFFKEVFGKTLIFRKGLPQFKS